LKAADIPEIRRLYREGWPYKEIATEMGVSDEAIRHVLLGRTWSHIQDPSGPIVMRRRGPDSEWSPRAKLDRETVRAIRSGHAAGSSYAALARQFAISKCAIRDIIKGRTWKDD
jgi:DNA invertase Pin-like site-specific DNA recombinase